MALFIIYRVCKANSEPPLIKDEFAEEPDDDELEEMACAVLSVDYLRSHAE